MTVSDMISSMRAAGIDPAKILDAVEDMARKQEAKAAEKANRDREATRARVAKMRERRKQVNSGYTGNALPPSHPDRVPPEDNISNPPSLSPVENLADAGAGARAGFPSWPSDAWEQFIDRYPNRRKLGGPRGAKAAFGLVAMRWAHRLRFEELLAGVDRYVASKPADENWMLPGTWLEDERWTDEAAPVVARKPGRQSGIGQLIEMSDAAVAAEREAQQGGSHVDRNRYPTSGAVTRPYSTVGAFRRTLDRGAA